MGGTTDSEKAIKQLRDLLSPGDTVYTVVVHVSRSGMTRHIKALIPTTETHAKWETDGETREDEERPAIRDISYLVAPAVGMRMPKDDRAVVVQGAGMDMGFHLVYELGCALWPDGFKTWPGYWRNEPLDFDPDGGYALRQSWP